MLLTNIPDMPYNWLAPLPKNTHCRIKLMLTSQKEVGCERITPINEKKWL
jgi:hypothetical protein